MSKYSKKCSYSTIETIGGKKLYKIEKCEQFNFNDVQVKTEQDAKDFVKAANSGAKRDELIAIVFRGLGVNNYE